MFPMNNQNYYYPPQQQQPNPYAGMACMPPQPQYPQQVPGLKGRPVSSIDEVKGAQIDFDGSLFIFPDLANKRIYTKQIGMDGAAALNVYELQDQGKNLAQPTYVTKEELDDVIAQLTALKEEINKKNTVTKSPAMNF